MDNDYVTGALCQFISSKRKRNITNVENKKENVESPLHSEINSKDLSTNEKSENYKRKSKKKKVDENSPQSKIKTITTKSQTNNYLDGKSNDVESNNNSKTFFGKKNSVSKLSDIKSSTEYIEKESRTIFVGNVPVDVKMSVIKNVFKEFGEIESMRLRNVAVKDMSVPKRVSIIKKNFHPLRNTANIYICYKTIEQAENALKLNATQLLNHTIRVDMALNTSHKQYKNNGLFIGNLPYGIQEDEIWDFFKDHGPISAVRVVRDNITGVSKGFGYIDFERKESVELAMQLQGKKIQGRVIRIQRIKSKASTKTLVTRKPMSFKKTTTKPSGDHLNYQGVMELKMQKKKPKPTKVDLMRRKIAKQLDT